MPVTPMMAAPLLRICNGCGRGYEAIEDHDLLAAGCMVYRDSCGEAIPKASVI
jgi:hypothetical protein